jgi:hypothetical protein
LPWLHLIVVIGMARMTGGRKLVETFLVVRVMLRLALGRMAERSGPLLMIDESYPSPAVSGVSEVVRV